jgi:hypothetical protein
MRFKTQMKVAADGQFTSLPSLYFACRLKGSRLSLRATAAGAPERGHQTARRSRSGDQGHGPHHRPRLQACSCLLAVSAGSVSAAGERIWVRAFTHNGGCRDALQPASRSLRSVGTVVLHGWDRRPSILAALRAKSRSDRQRPRLHQGQRPHGLPDRQHRDGEMGASGP